MHCQEFISQNFFYFQRNFLEEDQAEYLQDIKLVANTFEAGTTYFGNLKDGSFQRVENFQKIKFKNGCSSQNWKNKPLENDGKTTNKMKKEERFSSGTIKEASKLENDFMVE